MADEPIDTPNGALGRVSSTGSRRSLRLRQKPSVDYSAYAQGTRQSVNRQPVSRRRPAPSSASTSRETSEASQSSDLSANSSIITVSSNSPTVRILGPVFRPASTLVNLDPPPARRQRLNTDLPQQRQNITELPQQPTTSADNGTASILSELGITAAEYEQSLRAEQEHIARNQQIQEDTSFANQLASNSGETAAVVGGLIRPANIQAAHLSTATDAPAMPRTSNVRMTLKAKKFFAEGPVDPCVICFEDTPAAPFNCKFCKKVVGCYACVKNWYDNAPKNNQTQSCPLCRQNWAKYMFNKKKIVCKLRRAS